MSELTPEEIRHHIKIYIRVFAALAILTVLTVAVAYFHLPIFWAVLIALSIASVKGSLVAAFFMHLVSEKRIILYILLAAAFLFPVLLFLPTIAHY